MSTIKKSLQLNFKDDHDKGHRLVPKYFRENLTESEVKSVMETIAGLNDLFAYQDKDGNIYDPYQKVVSAEYINKEITVIF